MNDTYNMEESQIIMLGEKKPEQEKPKKKRKKKKVSS